MLPCTAIVMLTGGVIAAYFSGTTRAEIERRAQRNTADAFSLVESSLAIVHRTATEHLYATARLIQSESAALGEPALGPNVNFSGRKIPALYFGSTPLTGDSTFTGMIARIQDCTVALYVRTGGGFVQISAPTASNNRNSILFSELRPTHPGYRHLVQGRTYFRELDLVGEPSLIAYVPIKDRRGAVIAAAFVANPIRSMDGLRDPVSRTRILDGGFLALLDSGGRLLFHSSSATPVRVFNALSNRTGNDWVFSEKTFETWNYRVVAAYPSVDVDRAAGRMIMRILVIYLLVSAGLASLILVLVRSKITRRIERLVDAAQNISRERFDVDLRDGNPDEIGALAETLSFMSASIRQAVDRANHNAGVAIAAARESERQRNRAEEMNRLKTAFLANMSHEIRTPLTSIIGFSDLLMEADNAEHRTYAATVRRSGQRLLNTLQSILDLAQIEGNSLHLHLRSCDVADIVENACEMLQPRAAERGLLLQWTIEARPVFAMVDPEAVRRILFHLIDNAIKFTPRGGILVSVDIQGDLVCVEVTDTGIGIDHAFFPSLFMEFAQESDGLARAYEGNGLGLTISKKLLELMGGSIDVRSEKGIGTEVSIYFPLDGSEIVKQTRTIVQNPETNQSIHLLLVEDDTASRSLISVLLRRKCEVHLATDGIMALDLARTRVFNAVLMDINLGGGPTGDELLPQLRALPGYEDVPCFAITAYALPGDEQRFLDSGFDAYLSKPFTRESLLRLLRDIIPDGC